MKNYKKNYPLYKVRKFNTLKEMLSIAEFEAGDKIAFKYKNTPTEVVEVTYNKFIEDTRALGTALANLNCIGDHVACIGENSYNWVTVYLAQLCGNGVFVPIDRELPIKDIINVINQSDSTVVFCSRHYEKDFIENRDAMPNIKYFVCFDRTEDDGIMLSYHRLLEEGRIAYRNGDKSYTELTSDFHELKMLVYTSGTTGMSKGVMLSEQNLVSGVYYGLQVSTVFDVCLSVLPYHHTYEAVCGLLVSIHMHSTICINESYRSVLKNLQLYKPTYILLVPAFVEAIYNKINKNIEEKGKTKAFGKLIKVSRSMRAVGIDMRRTLFASIHEALGGRLVKIVSGGAPIRAEIGKFFDDIGINLINGYGITECSPLVSANRDYYNDCTTVGVLLPCLLMKLDEVTPEGEGEICVKGDTVMLGYYKNPEETKKALIDGWFHTGDYGKLDGDRISITGRKKNLIVLNNGKNIYPEEIEGYIQSIPYVSEVIVYSKADNNGDERTLCAEAFLDSEKVLEMKIDNPLEKLKEDIRTVCASLPSYKQIKTVIIRGVEFDKTTSKKIKRVTAH